jgi:hypothetical protein
MEPFYGNRIHRLVKSTHHLGAQALAKTHRLYLAAIGPRDAQRVLSQKSNWGYEFGLGCHNTFSGETYAKAIAAPFNEAFCSLKEQKMHTKDLPQHNSLFMP